jgi:hypothetical protein
VENSLQNPFANKKEGVLPERSVSLSGLENFLPNLVYTNKGVHNPKDWNRY